jgi:hypothetical protein
MHGHGGHHGGGHHGGHIPRSGFPWGNWAWSEPSVQYYVLQDEGVPDWVWIAGGAFAGIVLAMLTRTR